MTDALIASLRRAVLAAPDDVPLRLHLAELLVLADRRDEAVVHLAAVLAAEPLNRRARALMTQAVTASDGFDWQRAEAQLSTAAVPVFGDELAFDLERPAITLADVGGLTDVKTRLEAAFLAPLRNSSHRRPHGTSRAGGLMLYGPPGCGKAFLARAVAGELGAWFVSVSPPGEGNLHDAFELARRNAPCLVFIDEVDTIGQQRPELLAGLDALTAADDWVFVLAATSTPWDVDVTLRRPGRLDRTVLVLPPDRPAREAILRYHLRGRPVGRVDVGGLAGRTEGWTGADLAVVCEAAADRALLDSARTGTVRMIETADLEAALGEVRPSARAWFDTARSANGAGEYDELLRYLKRNRPA